MPDIDIDIDLDRKLPKRLQASTDAVGVSVRDES